MIIPSFIYEITAEAGETIVITGKEARHLGDVLRMKCGELIRLTDGRGTAHIAEIVGLKKGEAICRVIKTIKGGGEPLLKLTLAAGLSTGTKFDVIVEKGTEVGVSRFVPLLTDKEKVKLGDGTSVKKRMNRWHRVCEAAVKQSGRSIIPVIEEPISFDKFITACPAERTVLFHPKECPDRLDSILSGIPGKELTAVVGPISGFSPREIALTQERGVKIISLGDRVMRAETAGVVLPALVIYYYEMVKQ